MGNIRDCSRKTLCVLLAVCLGCVGGVPYRLFYPFGPQKGDTQLDDGDDVSSSEVQLTVPIHFYDGYYTSIFVNSNGHLTFESELPSYQATLVMPIGQEIKMIAAFLSDVDTSQGGRVFFRESQEEPILQRVATEIQSHFSQFPLFEPTSLFIATWDGVCAYQTGKEQANTFQIVIASDELNSFVIMNYLDEGIKFTKGFGKLAGRLDDPPAQAGFDSGSGRLHLKLPYSGTNEVDALATESNVNLPGVWMYHIGNMKGGNVEGPDLNTGEVEILTPELGSQTCLDGGRFCHQNSKCVDFPDGFCCECVPPYFGNGKQCISKEQPQRLNGKVSGSLNGIAIEELDMHAFVVIKDGRAYTAISRVPSEVSTAMMTLNTIGGVIGWLFALRTGPGAKNGFIYTGGNFKRESKITFASGEQVNISQTFYGHDALNNIRMETRISGRVPTLETTDKVTIDDYKEEYRRTSPGTIRSVSERTYRINEVAKRYTWDQTITFDECNNDPSRPKTATMQLGVSRTFIIYDNSLSIVRYAMSNTVSLFTGADPCLANECDENAECIPGGQPGGPAYTCECRTGFTGDGTRCDDVDECSIGLHTCDGNAQCINVIGSFQCQCNQGYRGDGRTCTRDTTLRCGDSVCDENSRCVFNSNEQRAMCECDPGFSDRGGRGCQPIVFTCNEADICDENADCLFDSVRQRYACECVEGFSGDGLSCRRDAIVPCVPACPANAECLLDTGRMAYRCLCSAGYTGDGSYCSRITYTECDRCHPNADCQDDGSGIRECVCAPGYHGDGYGCTPYDCNLARDMCDENAQCLQILVDTYDCQCNEGFSGDGLTCSAEGCEVLNNCDANADCVEDPRDTSRHTCLCRQGYSGDGYVCIRRVPPCNQVDNCSAFGKCLYDPRTSDFRCRCSRGYEGDGMICTPRGVDCRRDPGLCDPNASCQLDVDTFTCVCNENYRGDGQTCEAVSDEMNYLLFSRGYSIHKVSYTQNGLDTDGSRVLYVPDELAIGVAADCVDQTFYWSDVTGGKISRASQDGYSKEVVATGFESPEGIAVDWLSRNIYVTDSGTDTISVVSLDDSANKITLISEDLVNPRGIVLDPQRGVMFWVDWYRDNPSIETASMDGSDRRLFVETDLGLPNGLSLDQYTQQLCWGDAGTNRIECIRSDGVGRRVVTEDAPYPFGVALYGNTIYWSDWTINGVSSVDRNGGDVQEPLKLPVGGNGRLYGIAAVGEVCPRASNACYRSQNGGCTYFCLPTPGGGRTCACPDGIYDENCTDMEYENRK